MSKRFLALSLLLGGVYATGATHPALAQALDPATRQEVYTETYERLDAGQRPSGGTAGASHAEAVFNNAYVDTVGAQPDFDEYLQWKYLSDYPAMRGTAAVRQMPDNMQCPPR